MNLLLNLQGDVECHGCHGLKEQVTDGSVDRLAFDALTNRLSVLDTVSLADVIGNLSRTADVVANRHAIAAHAA